jgi:hypothetical protein
MSRINNYILYFLNATVLSKYSKEELIGILEFAVPYPIGGKPLICGTTFPQVMIGQGLSVSVSALSGTKRPLQENVTRVTK